jgi:hypothetical protein
MHGELFLTKPVSILHVLFRFELEETSLNWSYLEKTTQEDQNQTSDVIEHGANVWLKLFNTFFFAFTLPWSLSYRSENAWRTTATKQCVQVCDISVNSCFLQMRVNLLERTSLIRQQYRLLDHTICELKQKVQIWLLHVKSIWIKRTASLPKSNL